MKIRQGFISNSSTTSFICDYCGEICASMDLVLSDAEMYECVNGHTVCDEHINLNITTDDRRNLFTINKYSYYEKTDEEKNTIIALGDDEFNTWWEENDGDYKCDLRSYLPASNCPICQFEMIMDSNATKYLLKELKITNKEMVKKVSEQFSSYDEFVEFLK